MKCGTFFKIGILLIITGLMTGCGSISGGSPRNIFDGVVFIADREVAGTDELFIVDDEAAQVIKLSDVLVVNGDVKSFLVSPNVGFIAYLADQDIDGVDELYFIKESDRAPVKINTALVSGQNVTAYTWSPNGLFIAYIVKQTATGVGELYVSDARTVIKVSQAGITGGVVDFKWSGNSNYLAYSARQSPTSNVELYVSQSDGLVLATQLSDSALTGSGITEYEWAPNSGLIAYLADENSTAVIELYTSAIDVLSSTLVSDIADGDVAVFKWSNGSGFLAYTANPSVSDDTNLYLTSPENNSGVIQLSNVVPGGDVTDDFLWAPNDSMLAYVADQEIDETFELFITLLDGVITGTRVSTTLVSDGDVDTSNGFIWALASTQLIYRADQDSDEVFELYTSTTNGDSSTAGVKISGDLVNGGSVDDDFTLSPFGTTVAYVADQESDEVFELYGTTLVDNTSVLKLSADLDLTRTVFQHRWSVDGTRVFYIADQDIDGVNDAYTTTITGTVNLNLTVSSNSVAGITSAAYVDGFGVTEVLFPL